MTFKKSNEAFWWSLFSAGGVLSAMFLPAFVVISGYVLPNQSSADPGRAPYEHIQGIVSWWPVRVLLFGVIAFTFFHVAHRIRHVVNDLGWRHHTAPLSLVCYGGAFAGAGTAAWLLLTLPSVAQ